MVNYMNVFGQYLTVLPAYFVRDYRYLYLIYGLMLAVPLTYFWLVPESPRWLVTRGRHTKAVRIFNRIARANGKTSRLAENFFESDDDDVASEESQHLTHDDDDRPSSPKLQEESLTRFLKSDVRLLVQFMVVVFNWFVNNLIYFSVSLNTAQLAGNPYVNFAISATLEMVAVATAQFFYNKLGRLLTYTASMFVAGSSLGSLFFATPHIPSYMVTCLALTGKFAITFCFSGVYVKRSVYNSEAIY